MKEFLENKKIQEDFDKNIKNYEYNKKNPIKWEKFEKPEQITESKIKQNDIYFNPILQKYNNINLESKIIQKEKNEIIKSIIKSRDSQLSKEQAFNIINLQDKLKGFENHPDYPKQKDITFKKKIKLNRKSFNILSNLPLNIHHYDKPENRPNKTNKSESPRYKTISNIRHHKDYDIISNRYKHFNEEKNKIDQEINKINTARIFFKKNDYNPIKGSYFDEEKEKEFLRKRYETQLTWGQEKMKNMPKCAKGKSDVYNLITTDIVDPIEMNRLLKEEKDKKQRYELRYKLEKYYRDRNISKDAINENRKKNKVSFERFKIQDQRQYNIISLNERPYKEHAKNIKKGYQTIWETILSGANNNNTFDKKEIFRDPYDYSETGRLFDEYKIRRNKTLSVLKKMEDDSLFNGNKKIISKCKLLKKINTKEMNEISKTNNIFMDKKKFFSKKEISV